MPAGAGDHLDPAGRHANARGDGFDRVVGWTVAGTVLPGAGLIAAGRRKTGWAIMILALFATALAVAVLVSGRATDLAIRLGTDADVLLGVAVGVLVVAAAWCFLVVATTVALQRNPMTGVQKGLVVVLIAALTGIIALPAATASRYALSARSTLIEVFDANGDGSPDRGGLASPETGAGDPWAKEPRVNVLLIGSDAGADRTGIRPDTIIVASIDTRTGDTVLISLPRNLQKVPFPPGSPGARQYPDGYCGEVPRNECILNAIWLDWGEAHPEYYPDSDEPGLAATRSVVSTIIGMPIDYDVVVNLDGFTEVVDAMGGLRVNVPTRLPIGGGKQLGDDGQVVGKYPITGYIEPGRNKKLTGFEALWFARSREGSNDYQRMNRQRCVLQEAVQQYTPLKVAQSFPEIAASADRNVETDIPAGELSAFVTLGQRIKEGTLLSLSFTGDVIDTTDPDYAKMQGLIQQAILESTGEIAPRPAPPSPTTAATPSPSSSATPSASASGTASPDGEETEDALAAPEGNPIVDPATVCG